MEAIRIGTRGSKLALAQAAEVRARLMAELGDALQGADALVVVTEWKQFRSPDFARLRAALADAVVFDGRNLYEPQAMREMGFDYLPIGRQ